MPTVTFEPDGQTLEVPSGTPLLKAILKAGRPIGYSCRGAGLCIACRVRAKGAVSPPTPAELTLLAKTDEPTAYRIACLARVQGAMTIRADYW
jgi:ferredoxin